MVLDSMQMPIDRKVTTIAVIGISLAICYLLLENVPAFISAASSYLLSPDSAHLPGWGERFLSILFAYFLITVLLPFLLTVGWVLSSDKKIQQNAAVPFTSIIIPAYNEERAILRSLQALRDIDYPSFEVIVVNDGSTDFTFSIIESALVRCIHLRENLGKAAALNAGIAAANGHIIVFSDSDSWLHPMALRHLVNGFSDSRTAAVSGTVEIKPQNNFIRRWQALEYTFGQFLIKRAQLGSGASVAICPGPVCAYRKEILIEIGGFSSRTITEDFDATLELIRSGYLVNYAPEAIAYTVAPSNWPELRQQRLRWFRGHIQTFRIHRRLFFSTKAGSLGVYWLPFYYLFFGYICGVIELCIIPILLFLFYIYPDTIALITTTVLYNIFALVLVCAGYSFVLVYSSRFNWSLLGSAFLSFPYLIYLNWLRVCAILNETRGKVATWTG